MAQDLSTAPEEDKVGNSGDLVLFTNVVKLVFDVDGQEKDLVISPARGDDPKDPGAFLVLHACISGRKQLLLIHLPAWLRPWSMEIQSNKRGLRAVFDDVLEMLDSFDFRDFRHS